ncbi:SCO family protein [Reichenbachiella sp. MSK19-1]|uniref:SCO family protein n=1 Tax=Reichenbachiella sp. MSK19-1 TaxID=1897631 RepID=UPI000ED53952|nr:SCO family protein [Reichenbachiella sp. MSK19-1]RJE74006.1 electron transporter [Reichenbachiella sp. MSK19-1]
MIKTLCTPILLVAIGCTTPKEKTSRVDHLPYYSEATFTPHWFDDSDIIPSDFHRIAPFSLQNQLGETISLKTVEEKIYVVNFFFSSCPGICPKMTANMQLIQEAFLEDDEVLILSHSVTPGYDSIPILKEYATLKSIVAGKWHLLTGDRNQIYSLGRNQYFVEEDMGLQKSTEDFIHTENFVLVDQRGYIRGIYNGLNKTAISQLKADIITLKSKR